MAAAEQQGPLRLRARPRAGLLAILRPASGEEDPADPMGTRTDRVVPFVEDRRNCLILEPAERLDEIVFTSLQSALKKAIQAVYQLEDNEIGAEPLPSPDDRRQMLFYEAAEGGAGVLRRLLDEPDALAEVAREALRICHFDPETGQDRRRAEGATEDCEAACYDCLMTYANQRDHELLDRQTIKETLLALTRCKVQASPAVATFSEHLADPEAAGGSDLEREWLDYLARRGCTCRAPPRCSSRESARGRTSSTTNTRSRSTWTGHRTTSPTASIGTTRSQPGWRMPASSSSGSATATTGMRSSPSTRTSSASPRPFRLGRWPRPSTQPA